MSENYKWHIYQKYQIKFINKQIKFIKHIFLIINSLWIDKKNRQKRLYSFLEISGPKKDNNPGFKSYKILFNKFENPSTHSSQDLMEILDTILQRKLKFSFILLMILVFYNIFLLVSYNFFTIKI